MVQDLHVSSVTKKKVPTQAIRTKIRLTHGPYAAGYTDAMALITHCKQLRSGRAVQLTWYGALSAM